MKEEHVNVYIFVYISFLSTTYHNLRWSVRAEGVLVRPPTNARVFVAVRVFLHFGVLVGLAEVGRVIMITEDIRDQQQQQERQQEKVMKSKMKIMQRW